MLVSEHDWGATRRDGQRGVGWDASHGVGESRQPMGRGC